MCVYVCGFVRVNAGALGGRRRWVSPELELQVGVICLMWVLGIHLGLSARAIIAL